MKKVKRVLHFGLYAVEAEIIKKMEEVGIAVPETMRFLIREFGNKEFPREKAYAEALRMRMKEKEKEAEAKAAFDQMSEAEYAEKILLGKVKGNSAYFKIRSGQEIPIALNGIKDVTKDNNELVQIHTQLLNRTFIEQNGNQISEKAWKEIWKDW